MSVSVLVERLGTCCASTAVRLRGVVAVLALLGLVTATGAQAQRVNQSIEVGPWTIFNAANPQGESSGCIAMTTYDDGGMLGMMSDGTFASLFISQPRQRLISGTSYDVAFSYEGGRWTRASGEAGADGSLSIIIPGPVDASLRTFADMNDIELQLPNNVTVELSLNGSGAAITALRRCVQNSKPR